MTTIEAVAAEVRRYTDAAACRNTRLAHIRFKALCRLRGLNSHTAAEEADELAGDRMFGVS